MADSEKTEEPVAAADKAQACSVADCKRPYRAKGYCVTHYKLWRRGEVEGHKARYKICSKEACRKPALTFGLCAEHGPQPKAAGETASA